jgi:mono/diheme cytochrome c family protein
MGGFALSLATGAAAAQGLPGNPAQGRAIAEQWCIECHQVAPDTREEGLPGPPAFQAIADDPAVTELALRVFLQSSHQRMPNFRLTTEERDSIVAYILSLKRDATP